MYFASLGRAFLLVAAAAAVAVAAPVAAADPEPDAWLTLGAGAYVGQDYRRGSGDAEASDVGGAEADLAFTYVPASRNWLVRLRGAKLLDYTSNSAEEIAFSAGIPLGDQVWLTAGVSRLTDVASDRQGPTLGAPVELLFYPVSNLELMLRANFNEDSHFAGVMVGWAIGRDRASRDAPASGTRGADPVVVVPPSSR